MPPLNHSSDSLSPEEHLYRALRAADAAGRLEHAEVGLALPEAEVEPDTRVLLLRQVYLARLEMRQFRAAAETAEAMARIGPLRDIALHDRARALQALGEIDAAIDAQRLAARNAPPDRRSFQLWGLATIQHFARDDDAALATLRRGLRLAGRDRPLLKAHAAYIRLENDRPVRGLAAIRTKLAAAKCGQGYGQYLLGMIAFHMGDERAATVHLRTFLRRNAGIDAAKALTLREELRRARLALAQIDTD